MFLFHIVDSREVTMRGSNAEDLVQIPPVSCLKLVQASQEDCTAGTSIFSVEEDGALVTTVDVS